MELIRVKQLPIAFLMLMQLLGSPAFGQTDVKVAELLKNIQKGINGAQAEIKSLQMPPLDSVTLVLQVEGTVGATGGVNLWFVKIGGSASKDTSSQMTLVLKPASSTTTATSGVPLDQTIKNTIIAAARGVNEAQGGADGIPLLLDSLTADFSFTVKKSGTGGVTFTLMPVGGSGSSTIDRSDVQKITVKFAKPQPLKAG
jgi:hypothetical protein